VIYKYTDILGQDVSTVPYDAYFLCCCLCLNLLISGERSMPVHSIIVYVHCTIDIHSTQFPSASTITLLGQEPTGAGYWFGQPVAGVAGEPTSHAPGLPATLSEAFETSAACFERNDGGGFFSTVMMATLAHLGGVLTLLLADLGSLPYASVESVRGSDSWLELTVRRRGGTDRNLEGYRSIIARSVSAPTAKRGET
jgi:hypothetical protein